MDVNILLFSDFEILDAFGPVEILGCIEEYSLHYVSVTGGIIKSRQGTKVLTEEMKDADSYGILLIPGGQGTRPLVNDIDFIKRLSYMVMKSEYCLAICTGSALLAKTGLLDRKKATSNKKAFEWVQSIDKNVLWVRKARWVEDQKYYTSSGVSAGIDMTLGFIAERFGKEKAQKIAEHIEYIWNSDSHNDLFAKCERGKQKMVHGINLENVMVDCDDEQKLCEFYHQLLGWEKSQMFGHPALSSENGTVFLFMEEKDYVPPVWPEENGKQQKQMHFDFQVPDVAAAVEYAQSIGAAKTVAQFGGNEWVTMTDPAGHPFCLCAKENQP